MEIGVLRDLAIIVSGLVVTTVAIFLTLISYSLYRRVTGIMKSTKSAAAKVEALTTITTEDIGKPIIQAAGFIQGIAGAIRKISKTLKKEDEEMSEKAGVEKFGLGVLMGAAIGVAIGILYAPRTGTETRALIKESAESTKEKAEEILEEARERARKIIEDAKGEAATIEEEQK